MWLPALDAIALYSIIASKKPGKYLEIGPGNSTKFVQQAILDFDLKTEIHSIDPYPRAEIDQICTEVTRDSLENIDITRLLETLSPGDVVFFDGSHRSFQNSDVTVMFLEVIPGLPKGTFLGIHDINLPYDYEDAFKDFYYNEQYLLAMYLLGGAVNDTVIFPTFYARYDKSTCEEVSALMDLDNIPHDRRGGSSFWIERG